MENEELKTVETEVSDDVEELEDEPRSILGTVGIMAIGSGITLGIIAGVKKLKKVVASRRVKKGKKAPEFIDAEYEACEDEADDTTDADPEKDSQE